MSRQRNENLEQELRELHSEVPLPPGRLVAGREKLLAEAVRLDTLVASQALSTAEAERNIVARGRRKMNLLLAYKVLAAVMAVVVAVAGMGGGVVLAADSLPGEFLYPVKLWSEDVIMAVTPDPVRRAEFGMAFVSERVQEMARLAQQGEDVPEAVVARLTRQMEQVMVQIAQARPEEVPALLERVMERARTHQQVLDGAVAGTGEETQARLRLASEVMERTRQNAQNDPMYLEYQNQHQYEGAAGPHGEESPAASGEAQQTQEQTQERTQEQTQEQEQRQNQEQTQEQTQQQTQQQTQEQNGEQTPEQTQEQNREQTQEQNGEQTPEQTQEQNQEQYQYGQDGTTGPQEEQSPVTSDRAQPTHTPQPGGNSEKGH